MHKRCSTFQAMLDVKYTVLVELHQNYYTSRYWFKFTAEEVLGEVKCVSFGDLPS